VLETEAALMARPMGGWGMRIHGGGSAPAVPGEARNKGAASVEHVSPALSAFLLKVLAKQLVQVFHPVPQLIM
jgi:hypothetical protein